MTALNFHPVDEPADDNPGPDTTACHCANPDDQYLLEIDASSVYLKHAACGSPVGDWSADALQLPPTPVTLKWAEDRDRRSGEVADAWADLTINGINHPQGQEP